MPFTRTLSALAGVATVHPDPANGQLYNHAIIYAEGAGLRLRRDPPDPTPTNGEQLFASTRYTITGVGPILSAKIIPESGTPNVTIVLSP